MAGNLYRPLIFQGRTSLAVRYLPRYVGKLHDYVLNDTCTTVPKAIKFGQCLLYDPTMAFWSPS